MSQKYVEKVLLTREEIQKRITELGAEISRDYAGQDLLLICVLKGAVIFLADLMRQISVPVEMFYGCSSTRRHVSSRCGQILKDLDVSIEKQTLSDCGGYY